MKLTSLAWLLALSFVLHGAEETQVAKAPPAAFLITDYLPPAIYEGDALTACFRIENATETRASFDMAMNATDGNFVRAGSTQGTDVEPHAFMSRTFETAPKNIARIRFGLFRAGQADLVSEQKIVFLRDDDAWPETRFMNGRLIEAKGDAVLIPIVQKKRAVEERAFAPMQWIFGSSRDNAAAKDNTRLFFPGAWQLNAGGQALGPWPLDGAIPIIRTLDSIMSALKNSPGPPPRRVVILLPPEDLTLATDPRTYRVVLDALQARLAKLGMAKIVLISPYKYGCNEAHRKALWLAIRESAAVNSARVIDPLDWMSEIQWRADIAIPKIHLDRPNASGQKMIEQALANLIR